MEHIGNYPRLRRHVSERPGLLSFVIVLFLYASFISGCARDVANRYYGSVRYPPKATQDVHVFRKRPEREFTVIADFQSRGETIEDLREKAAQIGADAVIVSILGGYYDRNEQWAGEDRYGNTYSRITGTAIKFK